MLEVNGFIIDVRHAAREVQEETFRKGLIPFIPDDTVWTSQPDKEKGAEHGV